MSTTLKQSRVVRVSGGTDGGTPLPVRVRTSVGTSGGVPQRTPPRPSTLLRVVARAVVVGTSVLAATSSARAELPAGAPSPRPSGQPAVTPPPTVPQSPRPQQPAPPPQSPQQPPVPAELFEPPPRVPPAPGAATQRPAPEPAATEPPAPTAPPAGPLRVLVPLTAPTTQSTAVELAPTTRPVPPGAAIAPQGAAIAAAPTTAPAGDKSAATRPATASPTDKTPIKRTGGATGVSPGLGGPPSERSDLPRVALALGSVIGLILALRWGAKKLMTTPAAAGNAHLMQVVARTALAPRQQMLLVRVGRRLIVVGESGGQLSSLGHIEDPDEVAAVLGQAKNNAVSTPTPAAATFGTLFNKLSKRFGGTGGESPDETDRRWDGGFNDEPLADRRSERGQLLGGPDAEDADAAQLRASDHQAGLSEADAQAAVEAARHDIKALRAKLHQVTQRLAEPDGAGPAAAT